jgi:hypothetical protein
MMVGLNAKNDAKNESDVAEENNKRKASETQKTNARQGVFRLLTAVAAQVRGVDHGLPMNVVGIYFKIIGE